MRLSHSKLQTILNCPMTYFLNYKEGISLKDKPSALGIGSAVHYGIEVSNSDLSEYYKKEGSFRQGDNYTRDQLLAESMVHGYLKHKDEIFEQILTDPETGEKLELIDETHELPLMAKLKTYLKDHEDHDFEGIVDLLLTTNKGFIIIDYKTSSQVPDWDSYTDQLYRYIFLIKDAFPDVPIVKIGIINIRKTMIRSKKNENDTEFFNRLKFEYELNDENYINYHEFLRSSIDDNLMNEYIDNLSKMADMAQTIDENELYYINFANAKGPYGKSQYWDIFYGTRGAEVLYTIKDHVWNEEEQRFQERRDCVDLDMSVISNKNVLNKYSKYKEIREKNRNKYLQDISRNYISNDGLLNLYDLTYIKEKEMLDER